MGAVPNLHLSQVKSLACTQTQTLDVNVHIVLHETLTSVLASVIANANANARCEQAIRLSTKISSASIEDNKYKNKMSIVGEYGCYRMLLPFLLLLLTDPVVSMIRIQTYTAIRPGNSITGRTTTQIHQAEPIPCSRM